MTHTDFFVYMSISTITYTTYLYKEVLFVDDTCWWMLVRGCFPWPHLYISNYELCYLILPISIYLFLLIYLFLFIYFWLGSDLPPLKKPPTFLVQPSNSSSISTGDVTLFCKAKQVKQIVVNCNEKFKSGDEGITSEESSEDHIMKLQKSKCLSSC